MVFAAAVSCSSTTLDFQRREMLPAVEVFASVFAVPGKYVVAAADMNLLEQRVQACPSLANYPSFEVVQTGLSATQEVGHMDVEPGELLAGAGGGIEGLREAGNEEELLVVQYKSSPLLPQLSEYGKAWMDRVSTADGDCNRLSFADRRLSKVALPAFDRSAAPLLRASREGPTMYLNTLSCQVLPSDRGTLSNLPCLLIVSPYVRASLGRRVPILS